MSPLEKEIIFTTITEIPHRHFTPLHLYGMLEGGGAYPERGCSSLSSKLLTTNYQILPNVNRKQNRPKEVTVSNSTQFGLWIFNSIKNHLTGLKVGRL